MSTSVDDITRYLHEHIPITRQMGATVEAWDGASLRSISTSRWTATSP